MSNLVNLINDENFNSKGHAVFEIKHCPQCGSDKIQYFKRNIPRFIFCSVCGIGWTLSGISLRLLKRYLERYLEVNEPKETEEI